jgi:phospholipase C
MNKRTLIASTLTFAITILLVGSALAEVALNPKSIQSVVAETNSSAAANAVITTTTSTPIKHLIVIFQENISFDHYFATYSYAKNPLGEPPFLALLDTPSINGLTKALPKNNTNLVDPFRMDKQDAKTVASFDNNHTHTAIQKSYNGGLMDKFVESSGIIRDNCSPNQVMGYFDGNTVAALWNYAQYFAMSDSFHSTLIGPSLPGHINLVSGQTHDVIPENVE